MKQKLLLKLLRIGFDVSNAYSPQPTGIGTYVSQLYKALSNFTNISIQGFAKISRWKKLHAIRNYSRVKNTIPYLPYMHPVIDVFHGPDFWVPQTKGIFKKVITIHDLAIFHENLYEAPRIAYSVPIFERVILSRDIDAYIFVSHSMKKEFCERYPHLEGRTHVVYHGADHIQSIGNYPMPRPAGPKHPYIAYVGTIEKRKNIQVLIQSFERVSHTFPDIKLVLSGKLGNEGQEILENIPPRLRNKILYKGYLPKLEAEKLIAEASVFVYPSLYEGFGFPIIEAMKLGTPVITSAFGAMAEIAADAAMLCNTREPEELAQKLTQMLQSDALRSNLAARGSARAGTFTWAKCAEETVHIYNKIIQ